MAEQPLLIYTAIPWVLLISLRLSNIGLLKPGIESSAMCLKFETKVSEHTKISKPLEATIRSCKFPYSPRIFEYKA